MLKRNDIILILSIVVLSLTSFFLFDLLRGEAKTVTVKQNNKTVYSGDIIKDKRIELDTNIIVIKNSKVYMEYSDCKNQICVEHKQISKDGESIICLPNKVIITIE